MQEEKNPDQDILKDFQNGNQERAFRLLISSYQERLYYHIRRLVGNHEDADDVLQNTFIKAYKGLPGFKGESKLYSWLYRIASNESFTLLEKRKRKQTVSLDGVIEPSTDHSQGPGQNEIQARLDDAVDSLPPKQQLVFNLKYYEELKYEEISEITGTSVGALKSSYHIAVKKIEEELKRGSNLLSKSQSKNQNVR